MMMGMTSKADSSIVGHRFKRVMKTVVSGKIRLGTKLVHFECKYCPKFFKGPETSAIMTHYWQGKHVIECADLLKSDSQHKPARNFFEPKIKKMPLTRGLLYGQAF